MNYIYLVKKKRIKYYFKKKIFLEKSLIFFLEYFLTSNKPKDNLNAKFIKLIVIDISNLKKRKIIIYHKYFFQFFFFFMSFK
jgi:hypothetical protein